MSKGSKEQTQRSEPWAGAQPALYNLLGRAEGLYAGGQLGQTAGFTPDQYQSFAQIRSRASQPNISDYGARTLGSFMDPSQYAAGLEGVKQDALSSVIPAATAQFSGAGLTDSTTAQQEVGRAATQAIAPIQYGAYNQAQNRALQATALSPSIQAAQYMPSQLLAGVGAQQQALQQQQLDAPGNALSQYSQFILPLAGVGGTSTGRAQQNAGLGGILGGIAQAAPLLGLLSDRKLKRNIREVGKSAKGHNLYEFNYLWDDKTHIGVMADEVPHAIMGQIGPYSVVDYGKVM